MKKLRLSTLLAAALTLIGVGLVYRNELGEFVRQLPIINRLFRPTVEGQIAIYGTAARARLTSVLNAHQIQYPPKRVAFLANKASKELEVYCSSNDSKFQFVCTYPILGASGRLGPKLREGDRQVPEDAEFIQ